LQDDLGHLKALSQYFTEWIEGNQKKIPVRTTGKASEIRRKYLSNKIPDSHRCINLLDVYLTMIQLFLFKNDCKIVRGNGHRLY
jgi:hypothetical protein